MNPVKLWIQELASDQLFWFDLRGELQPLQGLPIGGLLSRASQEAVDHAYRRWSHPLVQQLGLAPKDCLTKVRRHHGTCFNHPTCQIAVSDCSKLAKAPWCFEPAGVEDPQVRALAAQVIEAWRHEIWVVEVK